ncbi:TetR/AcrR family transcriptional regulator [Pseudomonas sp.]|jgi:TetR/AcrR family transcriptional repressor of nem operon|uniref:TetR/AcrR family transcriptional regulator n=1 Tax=Pseudomonas sp. TaxID=306 RepID=UPI0026113B0F|nr:TetR/AcrR family transcriptional regulator [Pseudomonas sp.]
MSPEFDTKKMYDYIIFMKKIGNKEKLLIEGARAVHQHGLAATSVRDIAMAAGVPLGSFTNHFATKNAFGLEVLERYRSRSDAEVLATLRNDQLPPLERLSSYIDRSRDFLNQNQMRDGCLCGNISAEANEHGDEIINRVLQGFIDDEKAFAYCLTAAVEAGELAPDTDVEDLAGFVLSSLQGAFLMAKVRRSTEPVDRFKRVLFEGLKRRRPDSVQG